MAPEKQAMAAVSVRLHAEQLAWLNETAAETGSTMGEQVRSAVWFAMARAGAVVLQDLPDAEVGSAWALQVLREAGDKS